MKLTAKQRAFADEYINLGNATQAAIRAGYSSKTAGSIGQENLTKPDIKAYIAAKMAEIESRKIADAKEAMQAITAIARGETTEDQVALSPVTGEWERTSVPADLKTRLKAWQEILKRYPLADELLQAQLRKAKAEADLTEEKVKAARSLTNEDNVKLNQLLDNLERGVSRDGGAESADS